MSDIDDIKALIHNTFVAPVSQFHAQVKPLEAIHQKYVQIFCNLVWSLVDGTGEHTFSGPASNAFAQTVGNYISVEQNFSSYDGELSERFSEAAKLCDRAARDVQHYIDTFPYSHTDPGSQAVQSGVIVGAGLEKVGLGELAIATGLAAAGATFIIVNGAQQSQLEAMNHVRDKWVSDMDDLATRLEHALPPDPTVGSILVPPTADSAPPLTFGQKEIKQDIIKQLTREGVKFNESDIDHLLALGYDAETIKNLLRGMDGVRKNGCNVNGQQVKYDDTAIDSVINQFNSTELTNVQSFGQEWQLNSHYGLHGSDVGASSPEDYVNKAKDFMNGSPNSDEIQILRSNGQYVRWNFKTGEFGIINANGTLNTYYKKKLSQSAWQYMICQALRRY